MEIIKTESGDTIRATQSATTLRTTGKRKDTFCVYNQTRQSFLSLSIRTADTTFSRLRGLIGKGRLKSGEGLWVKPSQGVHTIGLLFPIDVIYLDADNRVLLTVENLGTFRISPVRSRCRSVLQLAARTVHASGTLPGDQLLICSPETIETRLSGTNVEILV